MGLGKNKKKQWRKCVPGIEDEIQKANQINEIGDISFDVDNKTASLKTLKYSTVPRTTARRPTIRYKAKEIVDVWAEDSVTPVVSKRRKELLDGISRFKKTKRALHPGTSYQPLESDHADLLQRLQEDHEVKMKSMRKAEKRMEVPLEEEEKEGGQEDGEKEMDVDEKEEGYVKKDVLRKVKLLTRREKRKKIHNMVKEKLQHLEKQKDKKEAHFLRNLPQLKKEIGTKLKMEEVKRKEREKMIEEKKEMKEEVKNLETMTFLLPSEVPTCLRKLETEGDIVTDVTERFIGYKFKVEKRKKHKKLTKSVKKNGLIK